MFWSVNSAWSWLQLELDRWHEAELEASFWWRDDDATQNTDRLEQLLELCQRSKVPLALAVIPASCEDSLIDAISGCSHTTVLQHGYSHTNHAATGTLKLELGGERDPRSIVEDLRTGYKRMRSLFNDSFCPVLVPPWNRIDEQILGSLTDLGLTGISTFRVCKNRLPSPGLLQVNTHLDPVNWRSDRGFIGVYPAIAILIQHLVARRTGYRDFNEPTGILSHHLAYNDACWKFSEDLFELLNNHPAASWMDASQIWGSNRGV